MFHRCVLAAGLAEILTAVSLFMGAGIAHGAVTTGKCLAAKSLAWGKLRQCQRTEGAKQIQGKPSDPTKCSTNFQAKLAKLDTKATDAAIACRYGDNGDTVTNYDSGLMWEKKGAGTCSNAPIICVDSTDCGTGTCVGDMHYVNGTYSWVNAQALVGGTSADGSSLAGFPGFAGYSDWRLPTIAELQTILLNPSPCNTSPCIDPVFGLTAAGGYWSSTTLDINGGVAWGVGFENGLVGTYSKATSLYVRAVRDGL